MDAHRRQEVYDAWAPTYDHHLRTRLAPLSFDGYEQVLQVAFERADASAGTRVLDLGTGTGNLAAHFVRAGCDVWGLDLSARMLVRAKRKLAPLHLVHTSLTEPLPASLPRFDRIVSSYALHDLDLAAKTVLLQRLAERHVARDGRLVIADIAYPSRAARAEAQRQWGGLWNDHEHYWAADETIAACRNVGLHCAYAQVSHCAGVFEIVRATHPAAREARFLLSLGLALGYKQDTDTSTQKGDAHMSEQELDRLLAFFKALANESRLKILGILANRECSVSDLADLLDLREPTVSHHLAKLKELDLVRMEARGNTHVYWLNQEALIEMNKDVFSPDAVASLVEDVDDKSWRAKVLRTFIIDGRLTQIPAKRKKQLAILQWLVEKFKHGQTYSEAEINEIIQEIHPDSATLRRYLIDWKFMARDHGIYWRLTEEEQREAYQHSPAVLDLLSE